MSKLKLKNLADEDLQAITDVVSGLLDKQSGVLRNDLASKQDLKVLKVELKDYIHEGVGTIMNGMDSLSDRFVEKEKFEKLLEWARIVGAKVGIEPKI